MTRLCCQLPYVGICSVTVKVGAASCAYARVKKDIYALLICLFVRNVGISERPWSDVPGVAHVVLSVWRIPGREGQRAVTSPQCTFHDTWSAVWPCAYTLLFAVDRWKPAGCSTLAVWLHGSLGPVKQHFPSPGKSAGTTKSIKWLGLGGQLMVVFVLVNNVWGALMRLFAVLCRSNASVSRQRA